MLYLLILIASCNLQSTEVGRSTPSTDYSVEIEVISTEINISTVTEYTTILVGRWMEPPKIEVCRNSPFSKNKIIKHLEWWRNIDPSYDYGEVVVSNCKTWDIEPGTIRFRMADKEVLERRGWAAYTYTDFDDFGNINYARVYLSHPNNEWIIRHEIGHAFGWDHVPETQVGHLMNTYVGDNTSGLTPYIY